MDNLAPVIKTPHDGRDYDPNVWKLVPEYGGPFDPLVKIKYILMGQPCELLETHNYPIYEVRYLLVDLPYYLLPEQVDIRDEKLRREN